MDAFELDEIGDPFFQIMRSLPRSSDPEAAGNWNKKRNAQLEKLKRALHDKIDEWTAQKDRLIAGFEREFPL